MASYELELAPAPGPGVERAEAAGQSTLAWRCGARSRDLGEYALRCDTSRKGVRGSVAGRPRPGARYAARSSIGLAAGNRCARRTCRGELRLDPGPGYGKAEGADQRGAAVRLQRTDGVGPICVRATD